MNIEEDLARVNEALNSFENLSGIPNITAPGSEQELANLLTLNRDKIDKMDSEDCAITAYTLSQYSLYIQRLCNKENANLRWIDRKVAEYCCDKLADYDKYTKYEHKIALISKENTVIDKLLKMKFYSEGILDRLSFVATNIKHMADMMKAIQGSKYEYRKSN